MKALKITAAVLAIGGLAATAIGVGFQIALR